MIGSRRQSQLQISRGPDARVIGGTRRQLPMNNLGDKTCRRRLQLLVAINSSEVHMNQSGAKVGVGCSLTAGARQQSAPPLRVAHGAIKLGVASIAAECTPVAVVRAAYGRDLLSKYGAKT